MHEAQVKAREELDTRHQAWGDAGQAVRDAEATFRRATLEHEFAQSNLRTEAQRRSSLRDQLKAVLNPQPAPAAPAPANVVPFKGSVVIPAPDGPNIGQAMSRDEAQRLGHLPA